MKKTLAAVLCFAFGLPAAAEDDKKKAAMMEAHAKAATPGPEHQGMKSLVGTFDAAVKVWMTPDAPPVESKGKSTSTMILGDRYLQQSFESSFQGQPFHGLGVTGYDNVKKKYVSTWIDDMSTILMVFEGNADADRRVVTMHAEYIDPMTGKKTKRKTVHRIESADRHVYEMWAPGPKGKEFKSMEIVYTRAKA